MKRWETALAAVLGHPVAHSLSPAIFAGLSEASGRPVLFRKIDVPPADLGTFVKAIADKELFAGLSVTIPHKETILRWLPSLSPEASAIGAVNSIHMGSSTPRGYNTDIYGVSATLREQGVRLKGRTALLYGAGGAAKAVAYALGEAGAGAVLVHNRSARRAESFCSRFQRLFPATTFSTESRPASLTSAVALIVNATPVGMKGFPGTFALPVRGRGLPLAFDLIYRPKKTTFLQQAGSRGFATVGGLDMLVWQAIRSWDLWFGLLSDRDRVKKRIRHRLERVWAL